MAPPETIVWVPSPVVASSVAVEAAELQLPRRPVVARLGAAMRWLVRLARAAAYVLPTTFLGAVASVLIFLFTAHGVRDVAWTPIPGGLVGFLAGVVWCRIRKWPEWRDSAEWDVKYRCSSRATDEMIATMRRIRDACVGTSPDEDQEFLTGPMFVLSSRIAMAIHHVRRSDEDLDEIREVVRRVTGRTPKGEPVWHSFSGWNALSDVDAYWRLEHHGDEVTGELRDWADAGRLTWWSHPRFAIVNDPPVEIHLEALPGGDHRPHRTDGPAVRWAYGPSLWYWHGVNVPADLIDPGWDIDRIHEERNSEVQRAAIERIGWLTYLERAGLELIAGAPDPANPPHELLLYADTSGRLNDAHILVMTNGSPDRSGAERRYAEPVPAFFNDPVEAAAWQYDVPVEIYRNLGRRT